MRLRDAARSAPARYSLIFAGISAAVMAVLLALIYGWATSLLERHLEEMVEQQVSILRSDFVQDGRESVIGLVGRHARRGDHSPVHISVLDGRGGILAGDLPQVPLTEGWQDIELAPRPGMPGALKRHYRGFSTRFDDDTLIFVAHDTTDLRQTRWLLLLSFAIAFVLTTALALTGGLAIGSALLRRVDAIHRTAVAIMGGNLKRRIPVTGGQDEFEVLAGSLNRMLARIEELMENLRLVTSSVAHDLRSPLGRLRQRLETARMKAHNRDEYEAVMDTAVEDIDGVLKTFDAILRIAQVEAGSPRERFSEVVLSDIGESVVDAFAPVAEDENKQLSAVIDAEISVHGDRELLTQLLVNLVENALRHTPAGTRIALVIENTGGHPRLCVQDNGPGVPEGERERVLQRFYRLDSSRSTPGNGLGLSFVAAVARLHDATISLEDNAPGLRVVVAFP